MYARDLMESLLCFECTARLGYNSASEIKTHDWFKSIEWKTLDQQPVPFKPVVKGAEDTEYFDTRGANSSYQREIELGDDAEDRKSEFGESVYKNLGILERANSQIASQIKDDNPSGETWMKNRRDSIASQDMFFNHPRQYSNGRSERFSTDEESPRRGESLLSHKLSTFPSFASLDEFTEEESEALQPTMDILIVEGDQLICKKLEIILKDFSTRLTIVKDGAEGVRCAMFQTFSHIFLNQSTSICN